MAAAQRIFALLGKDRQAILASARVTLPAIRLFDALPTHPIIALSGAMKILATSKPTAIKAIDVLQKAGILRERTGKRRDRVYGYHGYLQVLTEDTE